MKTILKTLLLFMVLIGAQAAHGQVGWLYGTVTCHTDGVHDSVSGAIVHLDYLDLAAGSSRETITAEGGQFTFDSLPVGLYSVTARMPQLGFATEIVEVNERIPSYISMDLTGGEGIGEYTGESAARGRVTTIFNTISGDLEYFLDVGDDSNIDYRLSFGSSWYVPEYDSLPRPIAGDVVAVSGAPFTYGEPPTLIVRTLNGGFWRDSTNHGGEYGGAHYQLNCTERPLVRMEISGAVEISLEYEPLIDSLAFVLHGTDDSLQMYLDFGAPWYEPAGGAHRPFTFDWIHVVGGLMTCSDFPVPRLIVYEINGQFWRQPGDTTGLGALMVGDVDTAVTVVPSHYLTAINYPNPFNATTMICYSLPVTGRVGITVFDVTGRAIEHILDQVQTKGDHSLSWNGTGHPSGVYLYRIRVNDFSVVRRMILLK